MADEEPDVAGANVNSGRAYTLWDDIASSAGGSFWNAALQKTIGITFRLLEHIRPSLTMAVKTSASLASRLQAVALTAFSAGSEYGLLTGAGSGTYAAPTAVSVGVGDTSILTAAQTTSARAVILTNTSAAYISIAGGNAAVLYSGLTLNPGGGVAVLSVLDGTLPRGQTLRGIASAAASNLGVQVIT